MKIKSLFDYMTPVAELPPEPLPTKVIKAAKKDGKLIYIAVERKKCI
jgi:hypothetical protein